MLVKDLFILNKDFRKFKLLAGEKGLNNRIENVDIMEVPDGIYWVRPGDFIVTTGYSIKKGDTFLEYIVKTMINRKVAALGIKVGRFIQEIPKDILDIADKNDFPIIQIPSTTSYASIIRPILTRLENQDSYDLHLIKEVKKDLKDLMEKEGEISDIMDLISQYIGCETYLYLDRDLNIRNEYNDILGLNAKRVIENNLAEIYASKGYISLEEGNNNYTIFKIEGMDTILAFLCIIMDKGKKLTRTDEYIIEEVIPIIAITLLSYSNKAISDNININDFYFNVLEGRYINNEFKLQEEASYLDIDINSCRIVWILDFSIMDPDKYKELENRVLHIMKMENCAYFYQKHNKRLVFIMELDAPPEDIRILEGFFKGILIELKSIFADQVFNIGVSKICNNLKYLNYAYEEADFSLKIGKKLDFGKMLFFYDDYMIYHLLCEIGDHPALLKIYRNTVKRLIDHDNKYNSELLHTVKVFIDNDFNINQAAEKLFIHRNTLYKRIEKINTILDFDINKSENRLLLQIALKFNEILDKQ